MKMRFTQLGISPTLSTPTQFDAVLKADWLHSTALIADFKILPD
jgi:hypothetical protein